MTRNASYLGFLLLICLLLVFNGNNINSFPSHIHAWSQSDRYALAIGFVNNNLDFFHPQTYNLTESPYLNPVPRETAITAVDFPINDYSAALLMKIFGTTEPWCFRLYTLIYSLLGLFFLFLLSDHFLKNRLLSFFVLMFALTSPVYLYYQVGFLPTVPALSNLIIGLYFFFKYLETNRLWRYSLGIFFITIATLSRKPFLIFLVALMMHEFWDILKTRRFNNRRSLTLILSFVTILGYFLYNRFLEHEYGSAFLNYFLPPENFEHAIEITKRVFSTWIFQYFTVYHYVILIGLIAWVGLLVFKKKVENSIHEKVLLAIVSLSCLGFILYYIVMMRQFPDHDYYFLDSFYPIICLLLIYLISKIPFSSMGASIFGAMGSLVFMILLFTVNKNVQHKREETGFWDTAELISQNFDGAEALLNEAKVPFSAKILVYDSYTTNIPFIKMKRYGYTMMSKKPQDIQKSLTWNYDYIVMQDCFTLSGIVRIYPQIKNEIVRMAGNGKISIYKKQKSSENITGLTFMQLDLKAPVLSNRIDFDSTVNDGWQNICSKKINKSPFGKSGIMTDSIEFSATLSLKNSIQLSQRQGVLYLSLDVFSEERLDNTQVVVSIDEEGQSKYCNTHDLGDLVDTLSTWKHIELVYPILPTLTTKSNELKAYIWNNGRHKFYYDNIQVRIY